MLDALPETPLRIVMEETVENMTITAELNDFYDNHYTEEMRREDEAFAKFSMRSMALILAREERQRNEAKE